MSFIDKYNYGFTDAFPIASTQEVTQNLSLTINADTNSGKLSGTVTSGALPVAGAVVKLYDLTDTPVAHTNTNNSGQYNLSNIPVGSYSVVAIKDGYLLPSTIPVAIQKNQTATANIVLVVDPNAAESAIYGIINDQTTNLPINDAFVTLFQTTLPTPTLIGGVSTNTRGQYIFSQLLAGQYFAIVDKPGYLSKQTANIDIIAQTFINQGVLLSADPQSDTGTIGGFIRELSTSLPVPNAMVALYSIVGGVETLIAITRASSSGRYLFGNVAAGTYRVKSTLQIPA